MKLEVTTASLPYNNEVDGKKIVECINAKTFISELQKQLRTNDCFSEFCTGEMMDGTLTLGAERFESKEFEQSAETRFYLVREIKG